MGSSSEVETAIALQGVVARFSRSNASMRTAMGEGFANPTVLVLLIALFQIAIWGALSGLLAVAPPDDSLEQVLLSQDLRFDYGKHPPLPTWILFAVNRVFGASIGATYVLGALCSVATMLLLYVFAQRWVGARRAALAAMLLSNIEYMNTGTAYFNHNTVQLPLALLAIVLFHRALTRVGWRDWALFGASCGVMMLAKFSAVVLFVSFAGYLLWARRLQTPFPWAGIAIAAAVGIVVASPYLVSIVGNASAPQAYAMQSVFPGDANRIECLKTVWGFASSQVAKVMPALLIFAVLRRGAIPANAVPDQAVPLVPFLTLVGFGPFVLTVVIAALTGAHLLVGWGTTFHVLLTFWLVTARPLAFDVQPRALGRAALASVVVQAALWALTATHGGRLPNLNPTPHVVPPPTPATLADAVRGIWAQHCAAALHYIVTDGHTGAALAIQYRGQPYAVDATRPEFTRFFPDDIRIAEGAVVVAPRPAGTSVSKAPANRLDQLIADAAWQMSVELPASDGRHHTYALGILPPSTGQGCEYADPTVD